MPCTSYTARPWRRERDKNQKRRQRVSVKRFVQYQTLPLIYNVMSYKSVKLRYMLSFARSADLKITDEKERFQAYIDNREQRILMLL